MIRIFLIPTLAALALPLFTITAWTPIDELRYVRKDVCLSIWRLDDLMGQTASFGEDVEMNCARCFVRPNQTPVVRDRDLIRRIRY